MIKKLYMDYLARKAFISEEKDAKRRVKGAKVIRKRLNNQEYKKLIRSYVRIDLAT